MSKSTVTPIVLTATNEADLNADIAEVNGAKSGAYLIDITEPLVLDDALGAIDLIRPAVTLEISGADAPMGSVTLDMDDDCSGFSILAGASHVTIDSTVTVTGTASPTFVPSAYDDLVVGAAVALPEFAYNFNDKITVSSVSGSSDFEVSVTAPGATSPTELFTGSQTGSNPVPVAMGLEDGTGDTIRLVDLSAPPLTLGEFSQLSAAAKSAGAFILTVGEAGFVGNLAAINSRKSIVGVDLIGGTGTLAGGAGVGSNYIGVIGGSLVVDETLDYAGDMSVVGGSLRVVWGEEAIFTGDLNVHGALVGGGVLVTDGGSTTVVADDGLVSVAHWLETGADTSATFVGQHTYDGVFRLGAGASVTVAASAPGSPGSLEFAEVLNSANAGGTLNASDDNVLTVDGTVAGGETFNLANQGILDLGQAQNFHGQIENFSTSDEVILSGDWNAVSATASGSNTVLLLKNVAAGETATMTFDGALTLNQFKIADSVTGVTASTAITYV